jgi:hypothetical protein
MSDPPAPIADAGGEPYTAVIQRWGLLTWAIHINQGWARIGRGPSAAPWTAFTEHGAERKARRIIRRFRRDDATVRRIEL